MSYVCGVSPIEFIVYNEDPFGVKQFQSSLWFTNEDRQAYDLSDEIMTYYRTFNSGILQYKLIEHIKVNLQLDEYAIAMYFERCRSEGARLGIMNNSYQIGTLNWFGHTSTIPTVKKMSTIFFIVDQKHMRAWQCFGHDTGTPPPLI